MTRAAVVGSGPNGLAGAVVLARAGLDVTVYEAAAEAGGGTRTSDLTGHGCLHDHCSAAHPLALGTAFDREVDLAGAGLRLLRPEVDLAHPLEDGRAAVVAGSLGSTAAGLGPDGARWRAVFGPLVAGWDAILDDAMGPLLAVPHHPVTMARFGARAALPAVALARVFTTPAARALWAGIAAHAFRPLTEVMSSAIGLTLAASAHRPGWVVAEGGSRSITDAMAALLAKAGGRIETGREIRSLAELSGADVVLLDTAPAAAARIASPALPAGVARAYRRWRHGPGAYKLDLVVDGGVPWRAEAARRAGTVHVGGTIEEIAAAEAAVCAGRMPDRPFVLVGQQYLADPSRSSGDLHPVWAYAHVPAGWPGDATDAILRQLERFAPGTRERIVGIHRRGPAEAERVNANYVGGDIVTGANDPRQLLLRPRAAFDPYRTGIPGVYLCSAATPPGAGAHGMCGWNAAHRALAWLGR